MIEGDEQDVNGNDNEASIQNILASHLLSFSLSFSFFFSLSSYLYSLLTTFFLTTPSLRMNLIFSHCFVITERFSSLFFAVFLWYIIFYLLFRATMYFLFHVSSSFLPLVSLFRSSETHIQTLWYCFFFFFIFFSFLYFKLASSLPSTNFACVYLSGSWNYFWYYFYCLSPVIYLLSE